MESEWRGEDAGDVRRVAEMLGEDAWDGTHEDWEVEEVCAGVMGARSSSESIE